MKVVNQYDESFVFAVVYMDFIREKIKEKPIDKRVILTKKGISIFCGIVFVIFACSVLYVVVSNWKEIQKQEIPYIGIDVSTVTDKIAELHAVPKGVFIEDVMANSPAMHAGLQKGDIIIRINEEDIHTDDKYRSKLTELFPGMLCEITIKRQNGDGYYDVICEVEVGAIQ